MGPHLPIGSLMEVLLPTAYWGSIPYFQALLKHEKVCIEAKEHYVKQSLRTRCLIVAANSPQQLVVPTNRLQRRENIDTLELSYAERWQAIHWRSIVSAYKPSPYFDYYRHLIEPIYEDWRPRTLFELNQRTLEVSLQIIGVTKEIETTDQFSKEHPNDFRNRFRKNDHLEPAQHPNYLQVFEDRHGFIPNLSILDLIFNEGPGSLFVLQS